MTKDPYRVAHAEFQGLDMCVDSQPGVHMESKDFEVTARFQLVAIRIKDVVPCSVSLRVRNTQDLGFLFVDHHSSLLSFGHHSPE